MFINYLTLKISIIRTCLEGSSCIIIIRLLLGYLGLTSLGYRMCFLLDRFSCGLFLRGISTLLILLLLFIGLSFGILGEGILISLGRFFRLPGQLRSHRISSRFRCTGNDIVEERAIFVGSCFHCFGGQRGDLISWWFIWF